MIEDEYVLSLAAEGKRADGRKEDEFRKIEIEHDVIEKAEGSARVKMGKTDVIVGVKMNVGEPYPDKPDEGTLMVGAEMTPAADPDFESGPPRENAIELARVVDRGIRESGAIDNKKLCIKAGEKIWIVFIDIHIMNNDGNLMDAAALAAIEALRNTKIPEFDGETVNWDKKTDEKLPLNFSPIAVTSGKVGDKIFIDANSNEEGVMDVRLTVTTKDDGNIVALQKSGSGALSMDEIEKIFSASVKRAGEIRKLLK